MAWTCACGQENEDGNRFCNQCGSPQADQGAAPPSTGAGDIEFGQDALPVPAANLPGAPSVAPGAAGVATGAPGKKNSKALVIILALVAAGLIAVCVIGIIAAIAIPNFLGASQRAKQAKAMAELRAVGAACEKFRGDSGAFPDTGHNEGSYYTTGSVLALKPILEPTYMAQVPVTDPWGGTYSYGVSADNTEFILICDGSDGKSSIEAIPGSPVGTSCFEDDMVFENGDFIQKPEGVQKKCK